MKTPNFHIIIILAVALLSSCALHKSSSSSASKTQVMEGKNNTITSENINSRDQSKNSGGKVIFKGNNNNIHTKSENVRQYGANDSNVLIIEGDSNEVLIAQKNIISYSANHRDTFILRGHKDTMENVRKNKLQADINLQNGKNLIIDSMKYMTRDQIELNAPQDSTFKIKFLEHFISEIKKGNAGAAYTLAMFYEMGSVVPQNYDTAAYYLRIAAKYGNDDAEESLGRYYENGYLTGGEPDLRESFKWYTLAAQHGNDNAKAHLTELRNNNREEE